LKVTFNVKHLITYGTIVYDKKLLVLSGYRKLLSPFVYLFYEYEHSIFFLSINGKLKKHFHFIKWKESTPKAT
jgi:hypothetical protein